MFWWNDYQHHFLTCSCPSTTYWLGPLQNHTYLNLVQSKLFFPRGLFCQFLDGNTRVLNSFKKYLLNWNNVLYCIIHFFILQVILYPKLWEETWFLMFSIEIWYKFVHCLHHFSHKWLIYKQCIISDQSKTILVIKWRKIYHYLHLYYNLQSKYDICSVYYWN